MKHGWIPAQGRDDRLRNSCLIFSILASSLLALTACGVQRPLIKPKDIPAYEEQQRKKRERIEQERLEDERNAAEQKAKSQAEDAQ